MSSLLSPKSVEQEESHWLSVADLMAGLMMVFLFIAIALMRNAYSERDQIKQVAVAYQENQVALYNALVDEFTRDLLRWDAAIDKDTLTFTFRSPDVLFATGQNELNDRYKEVLDQFFPRYMGILNGFSSSINEVRIEGHTSSIWNQYTSDTEAYFKNMELSQDRTRSVLNHVYKMRSVKSYQGWIKKHIAAVGFSSSKAIVNMDGAEDRDKSRRVSFRVITNAEVQIKQILESQQ